MDGLERVSRKEMDLADKIKSDVTELRTQEDAPDADQAKIKNACRRGRMEYADL